MSKKEKKWCEDFKKLNNAKQIKHLDDKAKSK